VRIDLDHTRVGAPLYLQLANALEEHMLVERLKPGDLLPSENVLAGENNLSRATAIKAYDLLIDRGLVTRRQGKGTFVNPRPMERQLPELTGFTEHVRGLGRQPGSSLISYDVFAADAAERPSGHFPSDVGMVRIVRLRTVDGRAVGVHRTFVPQDVAEALGLDEPMVAAASFSFYGTLRDHEIFLQSGEETLSAINADATDASLLEVDQGAALIDIQRESYDPSGRLVEIVRARYLGSEYRYHIAFAPSPHGGSHEEALTSGARRSGDGTADGPRSL